MDNLTRFSATKRFLLAALGLFVITTFALAPTGAHAQNEPSALFVGVQGGIAQSSFGGEGVSSSSRQGFTGGIHFMYNINEALSAELDLLYARQGGDDVTMSGGLNVSDAFNLENDRMTINYLRFPVVFKLTAPIEAVKVRALAGPSIDFLVGAKQNGSETQQALQSEAPVNARFLLYDLAGVVGGEIALPVPGLRNTEIALDGRYKFGFLNVDEEPEFVLKNRSFGGSLIFRIGF